MTISRRGTACRAPTFYVSHFTFYISLTQSHQNTMPQNYLIIGDDDFLREKEIAKIKDKSLSAEESELNFSAYSHEDLAAVKDALGTVPFLAEKRVVLLKNVQEIDEKSLGAVFSYLDSPVETSVLVITADAEFRKTGAYDKLAQKMTEVRADRPKDNEVKGWIRAYFSKEKIEISQEAVDLIVELKGHDTGGVRAEIEKLAVYSGGKTIEAADVEQLVGRSITETVFGLVDAIESKDAEKVFRILSDLSDQKKHPVETIGYLGWHLRNIQKVCLLSSRGKSQEEIARDLGIARWRGRKFIEQAGRYNGAKIEKWLSMLLEADRDIKTGLKSEDLAMEMLVVGLMKA